MVTLIGRFDRGILYVRYQEHANVKTCELFVSFWKIKPLAWIRFIVQFNLEFQCCTLQNTFGESDIQRQCLTIILIFSTKLSFDYFLSKEPLKNINIVKIYTLIVDVC